MCEASDQINHFLVTYCINVIFYICKNTGYLISI